MLEQRRFLLALYLLLAYCENSSTFPYSGDDMDMEVIVVKEGEQHTDYCRNTSDSHTTFDELHKEQDNTDNDSTRGSVDDLIFAAKKPQQQEQQASNGAYHQIDLLTSDEEDALTSASAEYDSAAREIELRTDHAPATLIDMHAFLALIPAAEVKSIAANYYRNDPEVQRAYAFLSSGDFAMLKQHIIQIPEVVAFLKYLNNNGFDLVAFLYTLTNLRGRASILEAHAVPVNKQSEHELTRGNEIANVPQLTTATNPQETTTLATKEQLNGLHGLVDSVLDILPQDQILATFFDKLESSEQFSKLVDSIGSSEFAKILSNIENSVQLRNLIFTLHNNGIYITRIVDSLKAYFFLGAF